MVVQMVAHRRLELSRAGVESPWPSACNRGYAGRVVHGLDLVGVGRLVAGEPRLLVEDRAGHHQLLPLGALRGIGAHTAGVPRRILRCARGQPIPFGERPIREV